MQLLTANKCVISPDVVCQYKTSINFGTVVLYNVHIVVI
jgi:hypothetical protein